MKLTLRISVITGGILNLFLSLFHVLLCYQIYLVYGKEAVYPLLQMLAIGGTVFVFFLAFTSLMCISDLVSTKIGASVIVLNILTYLIRTAGELIFSPRPSVLIISLCLVLAVIYIVVLIGSAKTNRPARTIIL